MKLDKFRICYPRPRSVCHCNAVSGSNIRICGIEIDLASPSCRKNGHRGQDRTYGAGLRIKHICAKTPLPAFFRAVGADLSFRDYIDRYMALKHLYPAI